MYKIKITAPGRAEIMSLLPNSTKAISYTHNMAAYTHGIEPGYTCMVDGQAARMLLNVGQEYYVGGCWSTNNQPNPANFTLNITRILPPDNEPCMRLTLLMQHGTEWVPVMKYAEVVTIGDAKAAVLENCTGSIEQVACLNDPDLSEWTFDATENEFNDLSFCAPLRLQVTRVKA